MTAGLTTSYSLLVLVKKGEYVSLTSGMRFILPSVLPSMYTSVIQLNRSNPFKSAMHAIKPSDTTTSLLHIRLTSSILTINSYIVVCRSIISKTG